MWMCCQRGWTAFHYLAAGGGCFGMLNELVERKGDPFATDKVGVALIFATA